MRAARLRTHLRARVRARKYCARVRAAKTRALFYGATTLHNNLAMHAVTFPQLLHQLRIKETRPSGKGKWVQARNDREQALFPPSPYNAFNLSDALATSLQALWLRTTLVELAEHTNK